MEYTTPTLHVVGKAQTLVLGGSTKLATEGMDNSTTPVLEVIGLDD
jgi:hypothetical protein